MNKRVRYLVLAAVIGALYAALTHLQNLLIPGSATWAIQFRASEALCILALFTPAAIPGLTVGCFLFNLTYSASMPLDLVLGPLATYLAAGSMYLIRKWQIRGVPVPALLMPALFNGLLVGWELNFYIGGGFVINAVYVALGEAAVLLTLGALLWKTVKKRDLSDKLFGGSDH